MQKAPPKKKEPPKKPKKKTKEFDEDEYERKLLEREAKQK